MVLDASINAPLFKEYLYVVISVPPLLNGGVNAILICLFPGVTESTVGAPGTAHVVTEILLELDESPIALVARSKILYNVLSVNPVIKIGEDEVELSTNACPFKEYLYVVIAVPPLLDGGVNATVICLLPGVADVIVGAPGTFNVVPETLLELTESPTSVVARSKTVYTVLSSSPVTTIGEIVDDASINAPLFNEYLYVVIADPPLFADAVNAILICLFPPVTAVIIGALGIFHVLPETAVELEESPIILVARIITLYMVSFVNPVIITGETAVNASVNEDPPFNEYLYVVISVPPVFAGGVIATLNDLFPPDTDVIVGMPG